MAAFGPSTNLLQQAILTLLQGRNPSPLAPVPTGPPGGVFQMPLGPPPEPAPVAPLPARDESLIEQLTGPRPVAPVAQPVSLLQKIALALQGFGAGTQGYGPQFLANLQEQRERPQREFRAATEQYEANRRRAIGIAEEKRQGEQADIQRRADIQSGREFQLYEGELRDRRQEARDLRLQAKQLEIEDRRARADKLEQDERVKAAKDKQRNDIAADLIKSPNFAPQKVASEIAAAIVDGKPMSPTTEKWRSEQARLAEAKLAHLNAAGSRAGGGNAASLEGQFNALKAQFLRAEKPTSSSPYGDRALQARIAAQYPAIMNKLEKLGYEVGYDASGIYPYIKPPSARNQPAAQPMAQGTPARSLTDQFVNPDYTQNLMAPTPQPAQALTKPQQERFSDIKRERPDLTDAQIQTYMRSKGWLQ